MEAACQLTRAVSWSRSGLPPPRRAHEARVQLVGAHWSSALLGRVGRKNGRRASSVCPWRSSATPNAAETLVLLGGKWPGAV